MKNFFRNFVEYNTYFWVFGGIATALLIVSFVLPPTGSISPSALQGAAELFGWASLGAIIHAIDKGKTAVISKGNINVTVGGEKDGSID